MPKDDATLSAASAGSGEPDTRGPAAIVHGSVIGGFTFIGPFQTIDEAYRWHATRSLNGVLGLPASAIVLLEPPERHNATSAIGDEEAACLRCVNAEKAISEAMRATPKTRDWDDYGTSQ